MSVVTTVVVASDRLRSEDIAFIQSCLVRGDGGMYPGEFVIASEYAPNEKGIRLAEAAFGGGKLPESDVLLGAFNHLHVDGFIDGLKRRRFKHGIEVIAITASIGVHRYSQQPEPTGCVYDDIGWTDHSAQEDK